MPRYFLRIGSGNDPGASGDGFDLADANAAWAEMTGVCGDLVGGVIRELDQNSEWHLELLDESRRPLFRIRVAAETLGKVAVASNVGEPSYP